MKIRLYNENGKIKNFFDFKREIEEIISPELPIDDSDIQSIIICKYKSNGGTVAVINDEIMDWINDYINTVDARHSLNFAEIEDSAKEIYIAISSGDKIMKESILSNLYEEDRQLIKRLEKLYKKGKVK